MLASRMLLNIAVIWILLETWQTIAWALTSFCAFSLSAAIVLDVQSQCASIALSTHEQGEHSKNVWLKNLSC